MLFYRDASGREPVREWLDHLEESDPSEYGKVRHAIDLLEEFGVHLSEPYSKQLGGKVRELRPGPWRITYFADPLRRFVLLTSFRKKGARTHPREIDRARRYMNDWIGRLRKDG
ncbi:MAG: type II toxin-antitoxin system RelE/ParE family toxin [Actinomycetota bacterium]